MRPTRRNLAFTAVVCALITALIFATSQRARGPVQDGRHLDEWLLLLSPVTARPRSLAELSATEDAPTAIRALGTNALPYLIQAIAVDDRPSRFQVVGVRLMIKLPYLQKIDPLRQLVYGYSDIENRMAAGALQAFKILGPTAEPAIPALLQLANSNTNWSTTHAAICALEAIGPAAQPALVGIIETNRSPSARVTAIGRIHLSGHAAASVRFLIDLLRDSDPEVVRAAVQALGRIRARPELAVNALSDLLESTDIRLRTCSAMTLASFGTQAWTALTALTNALQHAETRQSAEFAIQQITSPPSIKVPLE